MTLRQLRRESGLSWRQIVTLALETDPNFPRTAAGLSCLENRGTENYYQIKALAAVYRRPFAEVLLASTPHSRKNSLMNIQQEAEKALTSV